MGGKSKSKQEHNVTNSQTSINNEGEYAGNSGSISIDESQHDYDNSINDSFNTDNSIDDSYNTDIGDIDNSVDNSIENDGDFAGVSGNVSILDGGAVEGAFDFGADAIESNESVSRAAIEAAEESARLANEAAERAAKMAAESAAESARMAERATQNALREMNQSQARAFNFATDTNDKAFNTIDEVQDSAISTIENAMSAFSDEMGNTTADFITAYGSSNDAMNKAVENVTKGAQQRQQEQLNIVAELAKNTALQGQDIVANQSGNMVKYMSIAFAVAAIALFFGRPK